MSLQLIFLTNVSLLNVDLACRILCILDVLCGWREELGYRGLWEESTCTGPCATQSQAGAEAGIRPRLGVGCVA